jgi:hypothetical protein
MFPAIHNWQPLEYRVLFSERLDEGCQSGHGFDPDLLATLRGHIRGAVEGVIPMTVDVSQATTQVRGSLSDVQIGVIGSVSAGREAFNLDTVIAEMSTGSGFYSTPDLLAASRNVLMSDAPADDESGVIEWASRLAKTFSKLAD